MEKSQNKVQNIVDLVLKALAVGMSVGAITLGFLPGVDVNTQVSLLGIGLFTLALLALRK